MPPSTPSMSAQTRPARTGEALIPIRPSGPAGRPGLAVNSVQVSPPSTVLKIPLPGPAVVCRQGKMRASQIAA